MKKLIASVIVLAMTAAAAVPVFATDLTGEGSANTTVTYTQATAYTITIPASVTLDDIATVSAAGVMIPSGDSINVAIDSNRTLTSPANDTVNFTVKKDSAEFTSYDFTTNESIELAFDVDGAVTHAGVYTGTVTFTVSYNQANAD